MPAQSRFKKKKVNLISLSPSPLLSSSAIVSCGVVAARAGWVPTPSKEPMKIARNIVRIAKIKIPAFGITHESFRKYPFREGIQHTFGRGTSRYMNKTQI